jgi:iron complex outermembrane receptor protein
MRHLLSSSAFCLCLATTSPAIAQDQVAHAGDIIVTAEQLHNPVVAGKADIPLIETPQAISVVPQELIKARGVTRLADALRTVAGVSTSSTYGFYDAYTIRGYDAAYGSVYFDGLISEAGVGINQELFGLEQIEVVKGPASMLFGQAPLGGLVNLVSKRPQDRTFLDLTASTGSYHLGEGTIDANAPLNKDGTLLARLSVLYRDAGSFVRYSGQNRLFVAPALTWKIGPDTSLSILARYERDRDNPFSPLPAYGTVLPNPFTGELPSDFGINGRGVRKVTNNRNRKQIGYVFDHKFSDALSFSQTFRYTHRTESWDNWMFAAGFIDADGNYTTEPTATLGRYFYGPYQATDKDLAVDSRFNGKFSTGPIQHEWMGGLDYRQNRETYFSGGDFDPTHNPLNLLDPDYSAPLVNEGGAPTIGSSRSHQTGIYLQDHLKFGDRFTLTLGGRYDWAEASGQKDHAFSPRIGATAMIVPGATVYASWSKSFVPQTGYQTVQGVNPDGSLILANTPPERGENYEVGLKFAAPSSKLSGMISLFQLTRQNVANGDPVYIDYYIVTGEQRSRGIEIEGQWRPMAGLSLNLAYSYIQAKVTRDNVTPVGTPLQNVPRHNIGVFGQYVVPDGPLKDLGATFGVTYNSRRNGSLSDFKADGSPLFWLPSYTLFDAGLSYRIQGWGLQLNVANLFDKRYFPDACCLDRVTPGQPRNWRLTLSRSF